MSRDERANDAIRPALIEAAARLIATEGPAALTLRRVADAVGTSTMAIYTHFGGMPELRRAVRREGFARLAARGAQIGESDDPVADLAMLGLAYNENAISNPHLYRVMFMEQPLEEADADAMTETSDMLAAAVQRCIASGRFAPADARELARQFWAVGHGALTIQMAHLLAPEEAFRTAVGAVFHLFCAWGDDPDAARRSLTLAGSRADARDRPEVPPTGRSSPGAISSGAAAS
jgi:AcrR family transcriptional regulator